MSQPTLKTCFVILLSLFCHAHSSQSTLSTKQLVINQTQRHRDQKESKHGTQIILTFQLLLFKKMPHPSLLQQPQKINKMLEHSSLTQIQFEHLHSKQPEKPKILNKIVITITVIGVIMDFAIETLTQQLNKEFISSFQKLAGSTFYQAVARHKYQLKNSWVKNKTDPEFFEFCKPLSDMVESALKATGRLDQLPACPLASRRKPYQVEQFISELVFPNFQFRKEIDGVRLYFLSQLRKEAAWSEEKLVKLKGFLAIFWETYSRPKFQLLHEGKLNKEQIRTALISLKRILAIQKHSPSKINSYSLNKLIKQSIQQAVNQIKPHCLSSDMLKSRWLGARAWHCLRNISLSPQEFTLLFEKLDTLLLKPGRNQKADGLQNTYLKIKADYLRETKGQIQSDKLLWDLRQGWQG